MFRPGTKTADAGVNAFGHAVVNRVGIKDDPTGMAVLSIDTVSGFTEGITGGFVCESLTVGVHPQVERLPRNGIKIAEELNAFAFLYRGGR